jgi:hypothetical protein
MVENHDFAYNFQVCTSNSYQQMTDRMTMSTKSPHMSTRETHDMLMHTCCWSCPSRCSCGGAKKCRNFSPTRIGVAARHPALRISSVLRPLDASARAGGASAPTSRAVLLSSTERATRSSPYGAWEDCRSKRSGEKESATQRESRKRGRRVRCIACRGRGLAGKCLTKGS